MVNRVVPRDRLAAETMEMAEEIAEQPMMGLKAAKESVNQTQDNQGLYNSLRSAMGLQQLSHAQNSLLYKIPVVPEGAEKVRALVQKPPLDE